MNKNSKAYDKWVTAFKYLYPNVEFDKLPKDFSKEECFLLGIMAAKLLILNKGLNTVNDVIQSLKEQLE